MRRKMVVRLREFFFFNDTATTEIYTLSLHDALPIYPRERRPLHARRDARPGRSRAALLPDGARAVSAGGRAHDRARLLPGRARPGRAGAGARCARRSARSPHPSGIADALRPVKLWRL